MGNFGLQELILITVIIVFPLIALIDIVRCSFRESVNKILWLLLVIFVPIIGTILYFTIGSKQKVKVN